MQRPSDSLEVPLSGLRAQPEPHGCTSIYPHLLTLLSTPAPPAQGYLPQAATWNLMDFLSTLSLSISPIFIPSLQHYLCLPFSVFPPISLVSVTLRLYLLFDVHFCLSFSLCLCLYLSLTTSGSLCISPPSLPLLSFCAFFLPPSNSVSLSLCVSPFPSLFLSQALSLHCPFNSLPFPHPIPLLKDAQRNQPQVPPVSRLQSSMVGKKLRPLGLGGPLSPTP